MKQTGIPKWQKELEAFISIKSTFVFEGNTKDIYPIYKELDNQFVPYNFVNLNSYIKTILNDSYRTIYYDSINGFSNPFGSNIEDVVTHYQASKGDCTAKKENEFMHYECDVYPATKIIKSAMIDNMQGYSEEKRNPLCFILNLASRYFANISSLDALEMKSLLNLYYASIHGNEVIKGKVRYPNLLFIVIDKMNDLPSWFTMNNQNLKMCSIPLPERKVREDYVSLIFPRLTEGEIKEHFVLSTNDLMLDEIRKIKMLSSAEGISEENIVDAVFLYKYGVKNNPWNQIDRKVLAHAEERIQKRVKGQRLAIEKSLDVIKRAQAGFSGIQGVSKGKPKGVLFFAGPTGVGKTELAKTIAEILFGSEDACIRFDMSEYQQSHSDQKLLGAPPGYVGYEAGGQLTNKVKEHPFSILLFDEIEKAHPNILDKFLQILDDGRMTDGQGNTIYFSETLIIFTSNLGIYKSSMEEGIEKQRPIASLKDSYEFLRESVTKEIKEHFISKLGRPEILNRIGNNIVVFDYIRENVCLEIVKKELENCKNALFLTKHVTLKYEAVIPFLFEKAKMNLENGGRGIANVLEAYFINPLSRYCFDVSVTENQTISVLNINEENGLIKINCEVI